MQATSAPPRPERARPRALIARPTRPLLAVGLGAAVALGAALCFYTRSDMWLDEANTVAVARLPLSRLVEALRHDGAPPLYYGLLHVWTGVFGQGNVAARSLSAVFAVAALPCMWMAARRLGGRECAWAALGLLATNPYFIHYATEARMYSLMVLLVLVGWLALRRALEGPAMGRLAAVAAVTALLLFTHYWAMFVVVAAGAVLLIRAVRGADRSPAWRGLGAMAVGCLLFAPWLPTFLYQSAHTGTPWGDTPDILTVARTTVVDFGGGSAPESRLLGLVLVALVALALLGRALDSRRIELDLRTRPIVRAELVVVAMALLLGSIAMVLSKGTFQSRYAAAVFGLYLLAAAVGTTAFASPTARAVIVGLALVLGLVGGGRNLITNRTQGGEVAQAIAAGGTAGDLVVYCPDQLAPSTHRLLPGGFAEEVFPTGGPPVPVDWVDYEIRNTGADVDGYTTRLLTRAAGRTIWLVWSPEYRTYEGKCDGLRGALEAARPGSATVVTAKTTTYEHHSLDRIPPR